MYSSSQDLLVEQHIANYLSRKGYLKTLNILQNESTILTTAQSCDQDKYLEPLEEIIHDRVKFLEFRDSTGSTFKKQNHKFMELLKPWDFKQYDTLNKYDLADINANHLTLEISNFNYKNENFLLASANDKTLKIISLKDSEVIVQLFCSVIMKSFVAADGTNFLVSGGMDGHIYVYEFLEKDNTISYIDSLKVHTRLINKLCTLDTSAESEFYIASIGIDKIVSVCLFSKNTKKLKQIAATKLQNTPTDIIFYNYEPTKESKDKLGVEIPILMVTKFQSTSISIFVLKDQALEECAKISLNDAEFSNHEFSATSIDLFNPTVNRLKKKNINQADIDKDIENLPLITVGTSHTPYMRLVTTHFPVNIQDLLAYRNSSSSPDILRGMIIANTSTTVQQDKFSSSIVQWATNGSAVWVFADSGIAQAINFKDGSAHVMTELKSNVGRFKCALVNDDFIVASGTNKKIVKFNTIR